MRNLVMLLVATVSLTIAPRAHAQTATEEAASAEAAALAGIPHDAAAACQQMCSCAYPGGVVQPAQPRGAQAPADDAAANDPSPHSSALSARHGRGGATGYHSTGGFYGRPRELVEDTSNYPVAFVERPQTLPEGMTQPEVAVTFFNQSGNSSSPVRERLLLGFQGTPLQRWQAGVALRMAVNPSVSLDTLHATGQYSMNPFMNARFDLGWRHTACPNGAGSFSGGVGLPIKYALGSRVAIISGRPLLNAIDEDFFTLDAKSCGTTGTVGLPLGIVASLGEIYNIGLRTGYRRLWGGGTSASFVPFAFDFSLVIAKQADVGISFELPNALGSPTDTDRAQSTWFEQRLIIFAQTRL